MGFWQSLAESYDANADALRSEFPLSTTTISNNSDFIAVIVIDGEGNFCHSYKIEKRADATKKKLGYPPFAISIPVSEKSMSRSSSTIAPHPVFDQYDYLKGDGKKFEAYILQLKNFAESEFATDQIKAIFQYFTKKTVASDLAKIGLKSKTNVIFEVQISDLPATKVWEDKTLFEAWHRYYLKQKKNTRSLDYIAGEEQTLAEYHPKKIVSSSANAKLISDNDSTNLTYRGKFRDSSEAFSIGYESSQKAHQFLRYLIKERGIYCEEQVIVSFTIGSNEKLLLPPITDAGIWAFFLEMRTKTENDDQIDLRAKTGFDYAVALKKSLAGFGYSNTLKQHAKTAVVTLDAATNGRLSITFYRELAKYEYLESIFEWHDSCRWNQQFWDHEQNRFVQYIGAPSVDRIIEAVYGKPRGMKDLSYSKIKKAARERLLRCIFDRAFLPTDYVKSAVRRASKPLSATNGSKFERDAFDKILSTACAMVRKDYQQKMKGVYELSIEHDKTDRNYLYGRLLGAADKLEEYALYKKDNDREVTAAIRHMQSFSQRPFRTWQTIHGCLNPYIQLVKGSFAFNEIQNVNQLFKPGDYEHDAPLSGLYLLGYYHERAYIESLYKNTGTKNQCSSNNEKENKNEGK